MSSGSEPHSVEYDDSKFLRIVEYFHKNPKIRQLNTYESPEYLSDSILQLMKELEIREFERIDQNLIFICGGGVVGKCWGFIYVTFPNTNIKNSKNL